MNSYLFKVLFIVLMATSVKAQFLYMDYAKPYNNVYFQREAHMADRYIHETIIGDSVIQGESWAKFRYCVTAQMTDSCSPTRTRISYLHSADISKGGILARYTIGFMPPDQYDSSRVFDMDTSLTDEGKTTYFKREQTCIIDSQTYSNCYHVYTSTDSSSYDIYTVEGIGLVKDQQVLNSADSNKSYYYLRKLVQTATSEVSQKRNRPLRFSHHSFRIDGRAISNASKRFTSSNFYLFND